MKQHDKKEKMMRPKAVIVDIDWTIVSLTSTWSRETDEQWCKETMNSQPFEVCISLLLCLKSMGYKLVFVTARGQSCRSYTKMKFQEMGIMSLVDCLRHRRIRHEFLDPTDYKQIMLNELSKDYEFEFAIDDNDKNLEMFKNNGLKTIDAKIWWEIM